MTARDNAETADLTLEVASLREQLKESEGKCRALTVESEGWARQLTEATALLDEWTTTPAAAYTPTRLLKRVHSFLASRAPAQPAAPMPGPARYPGDWSDATVSKDGKLAFPEQQSAAPEPSAEGEPHD